VKHEKPKKPNGVLALKGNGRSAKGT